MIVNVCTTSPDASLARLGDLMALLQSTASSSGLDKALTDATAWVERHVTNSMSGSIRRSVVRETVAGQGSGVLMLSRTPLAAVARMFDSTSTADATEYCSTDFRIDDPDAGFISLTNDAGFALDVPWGQYIEPYPRVSQRIRRWLVEYEAGWQLEASSTSDDWLTTTTGQTLPMDVERAVLLKAIEFASGESRGVSSMKVGPLELNYGSQADDNVDPIVKILAPYRRVV